MLQPGNKAIFTTLNFRCNGKLESLTIPSQVRGSDYSYVKDTLEPRPSIWKLNRIDYYSFFESNERQPIPDAPGTTRKGATIQVDPNVVLSFNFTVMLQVDIQAGDVLGFQAITSRGAKENTGIDHLPLLYKPGPAPARFTPIVIANFVPTSEPSIRTAYAPLHDYVLHCSLCIIL